MQSRHILTAEEKQQINSILSRLFPNQVWVITLSEKQGASAKILLLESNDKKLIARISDPNKPGANIPLEYACVQQAAELDVAPTVYYENAITNIVIMEYVASQLVGKIITDLDITAMANTVATLHASTPFSPSYSIFDMINMIATKMKDTFPEYRELRLCMKLIEKFTPLLNVEEDKRPSHRDLHSFNLLYDKQKYYLIDWESAGNESFYFDLAVAYNTIICLNNSDISETWLSAYFSRNPTQEERHKFSIMRIIALIHYGLICLYLSTAMGERRITVEELQALPSYKHYIRRQIETNNPDMTGQYLMFGCACLKEALILSDEREGHANN